MVEADAIALIEVGEECISENTRRRLEKAPPIVDMFPKTHIFGIPSQHECRVVRTIKGTLESGDAFIELLWMKPPDGFDRPLWTRHQQDFGLGSGGLWLVFLEGEPPIQSLNCVGAIFPTPDGFRPEDLDDLTVAEAIHWIVGDIEEPQQCRVPTAEYLEAKRQFGCANPTGRRRDECTGLDGLHVFISPPQPDCEPRIVKCDDPGRNLYDFAAVPFDFDPR